MTMPDPSVIADVTIQRSGPFPNGGSIDYFTANVRGSRYEMAVGRVPGEAGMGANWMVAILNGSFRTAYTFMALPHGEVSYLAEKLTHGNIADAQQVHAVLTVVRERWDAEAAAA